MLCYSSFSDAGWSSSVARRAHNPKVIGSNPVPATRNSHDFSNVAQNSGIKKECEIKVDNEFLVSIMRTSLLAGSKSTGCSLKNKSNNRRV